MERDLYCYDYVERPSGEIVQLFRTDPRRLLQLSTTEAVRHADEIAAGLHVELAGLDIGKEVSIEIDAYNIHGDTGSFHLRWEAATRPAVFPSMQASLEIAPLAAVPDRLRNCRWQAIIGRRSGPSASWVTSWSATAWPRPQSIGFSGTSPRVSSRSSLPRHRTAAPSAGRSGH